ncbi:MAG: hypothetical protein WKG07_05110 [Hymenobacter sp.]
MRANNPTQALPRATGMEVGSTFKPVPELVVNAALWHLHLQDELVYTGDDGTTESVGATQRFGFDVSARYQLAPRLFLDADANYSHGRLLERAEADNYIPLAPTLYQYWRPHLPAAQRPERQLKVPLYRQPPGRGGQQYSGARLLPARCRAELHPAPLPGGSQRAKPAERELERGPICHHQPAARRVVAGYGAELHARHTLLFKAER